MRTIPDMDTVQDVKQWLGNLPFVRDQEARRLAEVEGERKRIAADLAAGEMRHAKEADAARKKLEKSNADVAQVERLLAEKRAAHYAAQLDVNQLSATWDIQRARLEKRLRETADPAIGEFISWAWQRFFEERTKDRVVEMPGKVNPITGQSGPPRSAGNTRSLTNRLAALRAAAGRAELMRYEVGVDVASRLDELRAGIPKFDEAVTFEVDANVAAHSAAVNDEEKEAARIAAVRRRQGLTG